MPEDKQFLLDINILAHAFLNIGWIIKNSNISQNEHVISALAQQLEKVSSKINAHANAATGIFSPLVI